jgi:hypothetical protein
MPERFYIFVIDNHAGVSAETAYLAAVKNSFLSVALVSSFCGPVCGHAITPLGCFPLELFRFFPYQIP